MQSEVTERDLSMAQRRGSDKRTAHRQGASHRTRGRPIEIAQQNLGHALLATKTVYVRTEEKRRMTAVRQFLEGRAGGRHGAGVSANFRFRLGEVSRFSFSNVR